MCSAKLLEKTLYRRSFVEAYNNRINPQPSYLSTKNPFKTSTYLMVPLAQSDLIKNTCLTYSVINKQRQC